MPIIAKSNGSGSSVSAGAHIAVCARVIDIGDQFSQMYGKTQRKVIISWEIPDETVSIEGRDLPKMISKEYSLSLGDKATLRADLESWRGRAFSAEELKGFDLHNILSKPCQLQVIHNDNGRAKISAIMSMPKGSTAPAVVSLPLYFDLSDKTCLVNMKELPDWVCEKIKASPQYKDLMTGTSDTSDIYSPDDGELPF